MSGKKCSSCFLILCAKSLCDNWFTLFLFVLFFVFFPLSFFFFSICDKGLWIEPWSVFRFDSMQHVNEKCVGCRYPFGCDTGHLYCQHTPSMHCLPAAASRGIQKAFKTNHLHSFHNSAIFHHPFFHKKKNKQTTSFLRKKTQKHKNNQTISNIFLIDISCFPFFFVSISGVAPLLFGLAAEQPASPKPWTLQLKELARRARRAPVKLEQLLEVGRVAKKKVWLEGFWNKWVVLLWFCYGFNHGFYLPMDWSPWHGFTMCFFLGFTLRLFKGDVCWLVRGEKVTSGGEQLLKQKDERLHLWS